MVRSKSNSDYKSVGESLFNKFTLNWWIKESGLWQILTIKFLLFAEKKRSRMPFMTKGMLR
jgi:hypothetical protein